MSARTKLISVYAAGTILCIAVLVTVMQPAQAVNRPVYEYFKPDNYRGKTGEIVLASGNKEFQLFLYNSKSNKYIVTQTRNGTVIAPVGEYMMGGGSVAVGSGKNKWYAQCRPSGTARLTIKAGAIKKLNFGPPFTASIAVRQNGSRVNMDFKMADCSGLDAIVRSTSAATKPPGFKVLSSSGKMLWQGTFRYG